MDVGRGTGEVCGLEVGEKMRLRDLSSMATTGAL